MLFFYGNRNLATQREKAIVINSSWREGP